MESLHKGRLAKLGPLEVIAGEKDFWEFSALLPVIII